MLAFRLEWLSIVVIALIDVVLASQAGLRFHLNLHDANLLAVPLIVAAMLASKFCARRVAIMLEFIALILATAPVLAVATYIALAQSGPLRDDQFLLADRALGFDWLSWFHFVMAHPIIAHPLSLLYYSPAVQVVYFTVLMGLMGAKQRMREIFWILLLALVLTTLISWLMPAMGPFQTFGLKSYGAFLPEISRVHSGQAVEFSLEQLQGIVTFPSFHTTLALTMVYAFRRTGLVGWILALANGVLLLGVPVFGGHYLVDMIAGAVVFALALAAVRIGVRTRQRRTEPEMAMAAA
ncbi:MAG: phosphatase PAP2 family protein [Rhizomicrobium sp.]